MITHEQYLEYKKLVDEYELSHFEEQQREADDQLEDDEEDERDYDPYCEQICNCRCGAYTATGAHISDCICGAD